MEKVIIFICILFCWCSTIFGQELNFSSLNDSLSVKLSNQEVSELEIIFYNNEIRVSMLEINETISQKMRVSNDTSISMNELFVKVDTTIVNDSLYEYFRQQLYYWISVENISRKDTLSEFTELRMTSFCVEVWGLDLGYQKKLFERCYYRAFGSTEYIWKPGFHDFYMELSRFGQKSF